MAVSERLNATIRDGLVKVVDTVLTSNVFTRELLTRPTVWKGKKYVQPVRVTSNGNGTSFQGMDTLATSATETTKNMEFEATGYSINVGLPRQEIDISGSDLSVNDLVKFKMEEAAIDMAEDLGGIFYGTGAGKAFNGLENIVDDGTNAATIGGLSRTTYPTLNATVTSSSGTLSLTKMNTLYNTISDGTLTPTHVFTTKAVHALYEQIAQTLNQYTALPNTMLKAGAGFRELTFKGIPVLSDSKCTSGVMYMLNMNMLNFAMLKSRDFKGMSAEPVNYTMESMDGTPNPSVQGLGFSWTGFNKSYNQYAVNGHIILQGEFIVKDPGRNGKLTAITTV
jgi:hypothetical protein